MDVLLPTSNRVDRHLYLVEGERRRKCRRTSLLLSLLLCSPYFVASVGGDLLGSFCILSWKEEQVLNLSTYFFFLEQRKEYARGMQEAHLRQHPFFSLISKYLSFSLSIESCLISLCLFIGSLKEENEIDILIILPSALPTVERMYGVGIIPTIGATPAFCCFLPFFCAVLTGEGKWSFCPSFCSLSSEERSCSVTSWALYCKKRGVHDLNPLQDRGGEG